MNIFNNKEVVQEASLPPTGKPSEINFRLLYCTLLIAIDFH